MRTPGTLARRAEWFDQLATLLEAGVALVRALEMQQKSALARPWRAPLATLLSRLRQGDSFGAALAQSGGWLSEFDRALLGAAANSGRLEVALRFLAEDDRLKAQLLREGIGALLYPLLLAHVALLIFPMPLLVDAAVNGRVAEYALQKGLLFGAIYAGVFLLILAASMLGRFLAGPCEMLLNCVPVLGPARRNWTLSRVAAALDGLLASGVSVREAWTLAASAAGSPSLRRRVKRWQRDWDAGGLPSESLQSTSRFQGVFADLYTTGEVSGTLDQALPRIQTYYLAEARQRWKLLARVVPALFYTGVVIAVAWAILSFYAGYFERLSMFD